MNDSKNIEEASIRREISGFSNFCQTPTILKKYDMPNKSPYVSVS